MLYRILEDETFRFSPTPPLAILGLSAPSSAKPRSLPARLASLDYLFLRHPQPQVAQLPRLNRCRSAGQQTGALLRLWERDHVPYAVEAQEHHQDAVDPESKAPVGGGAPISNASRRKPNCSIICSFLSCPSSPLGTSHAELGNRAYHRNHQQYQARILLLWFLYQSVTSCCRASISRILGLRFSISRLRFFNVTLSYRTVRIWV